MKMLGGAAQATPLTAGYSAESWMSIVCVGKADILECRRRRRLGRLCEAIASTRIRQAQKKTRRDPLSLPSATRRVTKRSTPPQRRLASLET
jgi:hypothetical protein